MKAYKIYTCWITCMLESYQDQIVAGLIKKGYTVSLASDGKVVLNHDNQVSAILALSIYNVSNPDLLVSQVYDDLRVIMTEMKGYFYSVVIAQTDNSTWVGSNIFLPSKKDAQLLPPANDKKSKLN